MRKKKELTEEERLAVERERALSFLEENLPFINEPTYHFNIGDVVVYGNLENPTVTEIFHEGKAYGLTCIGKVQDSKGKEKTYHVVPWMRIRPVVHGTTNFSENQNVRLEFNNSNLESLLHYYYFFGIDTNPDYQRGYVWEKGDQELLLDSIFKNINTGNFVLITRSQESRLKTPHMYEILDGKQRLLTLAAFYENRISYQGKFFNDLSGKDRHTFLNHRTPIAFVDECDRRMVLKYFLMLNRTGKSMDPKHLQMVEEKLAMLKEI